MRALEDRHDEADQHARQHGGGDRRRDALDERAEGLKGGGQHDQRAQPEGTRRPPPRMEMPLEAAIRAAPGVDQAVTIGIR